MGAISVAISAPAAFSRVFWLFLFLFFFFLPSFLLTPPCFQRSRGCERGAEKGWSVRPVGKGSGLEHGRSCQMRGR